GSPPDRLGARPAVRGPATARPGAARGSLRDARGLDVSLRLDARADRPRPSLPSRGSGDRPLPDPLRHRLLRDRPSPPVRSAAAVRRDAGGSLRPARDPRDPGLRRLHALLRPVPALPDPETAAA